NLVISPSGMATMRERYRQRMSNRLLDRLRRAAQPPAPFIMNPSEPSDFPLGRWNLYIGGAGRSVSGYVNLDLVAVPGVDVVADAALLPFSADVFQRVECDAVLEHVANPCLIMREMTRVLAPRGFLHGMAPFCHPFHEYQADYRRFTPDGLKQLATELKLVAEGRRTGPAATLLIVLCGLKSESMRTRPCSSRNNGYARPPLARIKRKWYAIAPVTMVSTAQNETFGSSVRPNSVTHTPTRMKNTGISGHAKLTTLCFRQPGRRRKINNDATDIPVKKVRVNPI